MLHASPIDPRSASNSESRHQAPCRLQKSSGTTCGFAGGVSSSDVYPSSEASSSSGTKRSGVKNSAQSVPRLQRSTAKGS